MTSETAPLPERIANGRTDLVFDYLAAGNPATAADANGVSLMQHCATTAMSAPSAICSPTAHHLASSATKLGSFFSSPR